MKDKKGSELIKLILLGLSMLLIAFSFKNIGTGMRLILVFLIFFYFPFLPLIERVEDLELTGKFVLSIAAGLSYGLIYVILDVFFRIPLTKSIYVVVTLLVYIISWKQIVKQKI